MPWKNRVNMIIMLNNEVFLTSVTPEFLSFAAKREINSECSSVVKKSNPSCALFFSSDNDNYSFC